MPVTEVNEYRLTPAGPHKLTLTAVEETKAPGLAEFNQDTNQEYTRWKWVFASDRFYPLSDEDNGTPKPVTHIEFTGNKYGNEKAKLTILLDQMVPGITKEQGKKFNTDVLIGQVFDAGIRHMKKKNGDPKAEIGYITPDSGEAAGETAPVTAPAAVPTPKPAKAAKAAAPTTAAPKLDPEFQKESTAIFKELIARGRDAVDAKKLILQHVPVNDLDALVEFQTSVLSGAYDLEVEASADEDLFSDPFPAEQAA